MRIKVSSGFSGVISTGSFQNSRPSFEAEVEFETDKFLGVEVQTLINQTQQDMHKICLDNFKQAEQQAVAERINRERVDFRFYQHDGLSYPSVTSIINWDADFFVPPEELQQYASQGSLYDLQAKHYIKTGEWLDAEKIEGSWADVVILKKGNLGLQFDGWNFPAFLKKYPLEKMEVGKTVYSKIHKFAGTSDIRICWFEGKKYLADVKRTPDKVKHFKQVAAYVLAEEEMGEPKYTGMMLIPANDKTEQGFSKPVITEEIEQYKTMFLRDRETFKKRFGL